MQLQKQYCFEIEIHLTVVENSLPNHENQLQTVKKNMKNLALLQKLIITASLC